jgi:hypothetical protein
LDSQEDSFQFFPFTIFFGTEFTIQVNLITIFWARQPGRQVGRKFQSWVLKKKLSGYQVPEYNPSLITITHKSVNELTVLQAPSQSVKEIRKVLPRLLQYMHDTPPGLHILFSKLDISDGLWRLIVQLANSFNFAYVLPQPNGEPIRIVVPSALQMGWVESPPLFCTVTESARDLTQHLVEHQVSLPHHK